MSNKPKVCVLRAAGTNCDKETAFAFKRVGSATQLVHINSIISKEVSLSEFHILAIPGGFTYGDDIAAGKILANELRYKLKDELKEFLKQGKLIIGICNGFQVLVKSGLLPGNYELKQEASLIINDSGKFEDRWVYLREQSKCVWTRGLPKIIYLPVAHGEGKFVVQNRKVLDRIKQNKQIVFQYCDEEGHLAKYPCNPNGSIENIAGICDEEGRILGLMPHPERHIYLQHHPRWNSLKGKEAGEGLQIFQNGIDYVRRYL